MRIMHRDVGEHLRALANNDQIAAARFAVHAAPVLLGFPEGITVGEVLDRIIRSGTVRELDPLLQAGVWLWASRTLAMAPDGVAHSDIVAARWLRAMDLVNANDWPRLAVQARMIGVENGTTTGDFRFSAKAAAEGRRLAIDSAQPEWAARFELLEAGARHQMGDNDGALARGLSSLHRAQRVDDLHTVAMAIMMLNTMPLEMFDPSPPVPRLEDAMTIARRLDDPMVESFIFAALTMRDHRHGRFADAARWCARRLELGRRRGWSVLAPMSIMHTVLIAGSFEDAEFAARMIGVVRLDLVRLLQSMSPTTGIAYERVVAESRLQLGAEQFERIALDGSVRPLAETVSDAITWLRRHEVEVPAAMTAPSAFDTPHAARARGARPPRGRPHQQGDRDGASLVGEDRDASLHGDLSQARRPWPCRGDGVRVP